MSFVLQSVNETLILLNRRPAVFYTPSYSYNHVSVAVKQILFLKFSVLLYGFKSL